MLLILRGLCTKKIPHESLTHESSQRAVTNRDEIMKPAASFPIIGAIVGALLMQVVSSPHDPWWALAFVGAVVGAFCGGFVYLIWEDK